MQDLFEGVLLEGRYRIARMLSQGNFGAVFHSRLEIFQEPVRDVAVKITKQTQLDRETARSVFGEALMLARIFDQIEDASARSYIVPVYDLGLLDDHDGRGFVVMGLIRGIGSTEHVVRPPDTLADEIHRYGGGMPVDVALQFFRQVCTGMAALHRLGVIHRDLKPDNILLTEKGQIRIVDFGLAAALNEIGFVSGVAGTHQYMAPETATHQQSDTRSDVYSLGIILYEMLTGHYPFRHLTAPADRTPSQRVEWIVQQKSQIQLSKTSAHNSEIEAWVDQLVSDCLAFEPGAGRPQNASALLERLDRGGATPALSLPEGNWRTWIDAKHVDWRNAEDELQQAVAQLAETDDRWFDAVTRLAICHIKLGRPSPAEALLRRLEDAIRCGAAATSYRDRHDLYRGLARATRRRPGMHHWSLDFELKADDASRKGNL